MPLRPFVRAAVASLVLAGAGVPAACARGPRPASLPAPRPASDVPPGVPVPVGPLPGEPIAPPPGAAAAPLPAAPPEPEPHEHASGVAWDIDVHAYEAHERVRHYVALFAGSARERFEARLARGARYDVMIRAKLRAAGLPEDLTYLALIESGYDPHAVSRANAVGMWQFMAPTARDVGLRVDAWVDERRDPVRATDGAARMLRWLKSEYGGSLFVAAAAYNGGPGRVSRGLARLAAAADSSAGEARFFALADFGLVHDETKNYVPQLIAAALVAKEAAQHGIRVRDAAPFAYDSVTVPPLTPLAAVAAAGRATRAEVLDLNPHVLRGMTPPGRPTPVRVPVGAGAGFARRLAALDAGERRAFRTTTTRKRETRAALANRLGVRAAVIAAFNGELATARKGKWKGRLIGGQTVRVPTRAVLAYAYGTPGADGSAR